MTGHPAATRLANIILEILFMIKIDLQFVKALCSIIGRIVKQV